MSIALTDLLKVHSLNNKLHDLSREYVHSRPLVISENDLALKSEERKHKFSTSYDLKDIALIGAVRHASVLMTGGTDLGKTTFAKLVMNSFFGTEDEGWHRIDVDVDFGKDSYSDVDLGAIQDGKKVSEIYSLQDYFKFPGLILDEINRTHGKLANKIIHILDKDISLPNGKRAKIGVKLDSGEHYQFQIAAINEGSDYKGTFDMDKALRRRTIIEIPMDIFTLTPQDRKQLKEKRPRILFDNKTNSLVDILSVYSASESLQLHPTAETFVLYLEAFDFCKHSLTSEKGGLVMQGDSFYDFCTKRPVTAGSAKTTSIMSCEFTKTFNNDMCPYVRALTPGVANNLISVAKGFAILRATKFIELLAGFTKEIFERPLSFSLDKPEFFKSSLQKYTKTDYEGKDLAKAAIDKYVSDLCVETSDIEAALGFVGYSKLGISSNWTRKHLQGNQFEAIKTFSREAKKHFLQGLKEINNPSAIFDGSATKEEIAHARMYCKKENPWLWRVIVPYIQEEEKRLPLALIEELYEG